jgi:hypothetical protein
VNLSPIWNNLCIDFIKQHPFAAGITLEGFTVVSVDGNWQKAFIPSTAGAIHKAGHILQMMETIV